ncbi:hypothetical protein Gotur_032317 [Gossypium turneri]
MDSSEFVKALQRNKVVERLAKVVSDRNIEVHVFVNFLEEMLDEFGFDKVVEFPFTMAPPNQLCLVLVIFLSILSLSSLPTSAIIPKPSISLPIPPSQLVEN